jgi:hypothetical protein
MFDTYLIKNNKIYEFINYRNKFNTWGIILPPVIKIVQVNKVTNERLKNKEYPKTIEFSTCSM